MICNVDWGDHSDTCNWSSRVPENTLFYDILWHVLSCSYIFSLVSLVQWGSGLVWKIMQDSFIKSMGLRLSWVLISDSNLITCFKTSGMSSTLVIGGLTKLRNSQWLDWSKTLFDKAIKRSRFPAVSTVQSLALSRLWNIFCADLPPPFRHEWNA